jgi:hypothetical protein
VTEDDRKRVRDIWQRALHAMSVMARNRKEEGVNWAIANGEIERWAVLIQNAGARASLNEIQNKLSWVSYSPSIERFNRPWIKG